MSFLKAMKTALSVAHQNYEKNLNLAISNVEKMAITTPIPKIKDSFITYILSDACYTTLISSF